jgi:hypothetical protein
MQMNIPNLKLSSDSSRIGFSKLRLVSQSETRD